MPEVSVVETELRQFMSMNHSKQGSFSVVKISKVRAECKRPGWRWRT